MRPFPGNVNPVKTARVLFFLNAAIWLLFGLVSLFNWAPGGSVSWFVTLVIAVLMFGNAAAMLLTGIVLARQRRLVYFFAIALLVVNILLTITDQVGLPDLITLIIDSILLALLIALPKRFSSPSAP